MRSLDINILYYFSEVVRERSLTKAAHKLCLKVSTLSKKMTILESILGVKLFERNRKPLIPTPEGIAIAYHLQQIRDYLLYARGTKMAKTDELEGEVHIHCDGTVMEAPILELSTKFYESNPRVTFDYKKDETSNKWNTGIYVINSGDGISSDRIIGNFLPQRFGVLVPSGIPLAEGELPVADALARYNLYVPESYGITEFNNRRSNICLCNDIRKAEYYVSKSMGLAIVPMNASEYYRRYELDVLPLIPELVLSPVLVTNRFGMLTPVERAFVEYMAASGLISINSSSLY